MAAILIQNTFDGMVSHAESARMLLGSPSSMINIICYQLVLNFVDIKFVLMSGSLWTQQVKFGLLPLFPLSVNN